MTTEAPTKARSLLRFFWWTLGILVVLLAGLMALSMSSPDAPFSYVLR